MQPPSFAARIVPPEQAAEAARRLPRPLVFTNGVFDLLHRGHVTCLDRARSLGASLVVALNADASARRLGKGADRPLNPLEDRLALVAALACCDLATWFEADTPLDLILALRPDVVAKGGDWPAGRIVGAREAAAWNGRAVSIPFEHERSTSALVARIRGG